MISRAQNHAQCKAIIDAQGVYTYEQLLDASASIAARLLGNQKDLSEARVALMIKPGFDYVKVQWAIWRAGGIAVPLSLHSPLPALEHILTDSQCKTIITDEAHYQTLVGLDDASNYSIYQLKDLEAEPVALPEIALDRKAMIIYTSGTTGKPKGVVSTHRTIQAQITTLVEAWRWQPQDHILNVLPLHHVHGVVNVLLCALWSGACCEFAPFKAPEVLHRLCQGDISLFMAVPTIYYKLIDHWKGLGANEKEEVYQALSQFRLMVSGSAALPVKVMELWEELSGQKLLERYGMTEIGMAISNPYKGERRAGHIGQPLPRVAVKLVDEKGLEVPAGEPGEIMIKGLSVFKEYWNRPEATREAFTEDGWFKTGDVAVFNQGSYRILGRSSVDIIKSGGYKISALEIEEVLRRHPAVADCAVVGIPDEEWGEFIAAGVVWQFNEAMDVTELTDWLKERLPVYQVPRRFLSLEALPRNAMGKVMKPDLKKLF